MPRQNKKSDWDDVYTKPGKKIRLPPDWSDEDMLTPLEPSEPTDDEIREDAALWWQEYMRSDEDLE